MNKLETLWYNICKTNKVCDWIDNHILLYIWYKPKNKYEEVKHWFYCNWNKEHLKTVKSAFLGYPWDYTYFNELSEYKLVEMERWYTNHKPYENSDIKILRWIKIARYCLHIINNDQLIEYIPEEKNRDSRFKYIGPYINYNNIKRFINMSSYENATDIDSIINMYKKYPETYYILKCENLYYKILKNYLNNW